MMKKLISIILCFCMFFSAFVYPAAAGAKMASDTEGAEPIELNDIIGSKEETIKSDAAGDAAGDADGDADGDEDDEPTLYLQDIMFGVFETLDKAYDFLEGRGFTVYECNFYEGTYPINSKKDFCLYMGYKTTTSRSMALTDIRMMNDQQVSALNDGMFSAVYTYNGAGYMSVPVRYEYQEFVPQAGLLGLMATDKFLDGYEAWGSANPDVGYTAARCMSCILSWFGVGFYYFLWNMLKDSFSDEYKVETYWSLYTTRSKKCGDPILADFIIDGNKQLDGYETATQFCSDTPYDMGFSRGSAFVSRHSAYDEWNKLYFHFQRESTTVEQPSDKTYISEIILLSNTMTDAEANALGFTVIDKEWMNFTSGAYLLSREPSGYEEQCRIAYKTTHYKSKALTDIRLINSSDYHTPPRTIQYRGETYMSVGIYTYEYGEFYYLLNGVAEVRHGYKRKINVDSEVTALRNIYVTTSPVCGEPIEEIALIKDPEYMTPRVENGWQLARLFYNDIPATSGVYTENNFRENQYNYYLSFKGESTPITGKYIASVSAGVTSSHENNYYEGQLFAENTALRQLLSGGSTYKIEWNLAYNEVKYVMNNHGRAAYIGYSRTDDETLALTDIIVVKSDDTPERSVYHNNIKYMLADGVDLNSGNGGDYLYLYETTDTNAGSPLTDLNIRMLDAISDGEVVVSVDRNGGCNLRDTYDQRSPHYVDGNRYLIKTRADDSVPRYISQITTFAGGNIAQVNNNRAGSGYNYYTKVNFNQNAGGDMVYICYNRSGYVDDAITGLLCRHSDTDWHPASFTYKGVEYKDAGGENLNKNAGGDYIFLYFTRDENAGDPISDIIGATTKALHNDGTQVVMRANGNAAPSNANAGTSGDLQYIHYARYNKNASKFIYINDIQATYGYDFFNSIGSWISNYQNTKKYTPGIIDGEWWIDKLVGSDGAREYLESKGCIYAAARPFAPFKTYKNAGLFIGFNLTDDKTQAVRDIRYFIGERNYILTDKKTGATYRAASDMPIYTDDGALTFLYYSTDEAAGDPITGADMKRNFPLLPLTDYTQTETNESPYYDPDDDGFYHFGSGSLRR